MANIETNKVDATTSIITVHVHKSDYLPVYEQELKKYRSKAQLKGFRPGTAPISVVKKLYGKTLMYETIMDIVQRELMAGIRTQGLNVLGQPELVVDQSDKMDISLDEPVEKYALSFKVGHYHLDLQGIDKTITLQRYKLTDLTTRAETELDRMARSQVKPEETSDTIQQDDFFYVDAKELNADGSVKEGGHETTITVFTKSMKMAPEAQELFIGKLRAGSEVTFNPRQLDFFGSEWTAEEQEKRYRRYILNLNEEDTREVNDLFKGKITSVLRTGEPVLDAAFFKSQFGEEVETKEQAIEQLKLRLENEFDNLFQNNLRRQAIVALIERNQFALPADMLINYMRQNDARLTDENIQENTAALLNQVRLQIITDTLAEDLGIGQVEQKDIEAYLAEQVREQYGFYIPDQYLKPIIKNQMANKTMINNIRYELRQNKIMDYVVSQMDIKSISVSEEELKERIESEHQRERALFSIKYAKAEQPAAS